MAIKYKIDGDIPIPSKTGGKPLTAFSAAVMSLEPGQSFFDADDQVRVWSRLSYYKRITGREFTTRKCEEGGVAGVRIWRTE